MSGTIAARQFARPMLALASLLIAALAMLLVVAPRPAQAQASPSDYTTGYRYDAMRRLVGTISPDPDAGGTIKYGAVRNTYDVKGRLIKVERGELATWQSESVAPSAWPGFTIFSTTDIGYDVAWRKVTETVSSGGTTYTLTQYSYDNDNRLDCTAIRMNPGAFGSLPASACTLGTQGANGPDRISKNIYDGANQKLQEQRAFGTALQQNYATYTYSNNGKQTSVTDANGNKASFTWDGFDRQYRWNFPSKTTPGTVSTTDYEEYAYDQNGNRTSLRKRDGQTIGYSYDALNRISLKDIPGGTAADVYYGYDLRNLQLYARFVSDSGQGVTSAYDNAGRITSSVNTTGGTSRTLGYGYDANGNRITLNFPDSASGGSFTYDYDGLNRMIALKRGATTINTIVYNAKGERTSLTGSITTSYTYDPLSRFGSVTHDLSGTTQDVTYCMGTISGSCSPSYNAASQALAKTVSNDAYAFTQQYNANRAYTVNGLNQYTGISGASLTYDANGNLTSDGSTTYAYDVENRLTSATGSTSATLTYDPLGRIYQTVSGTTTTRFLYDGDALIAEYNSAGTMQRRYLHGPGVDEPILWYEGANFSSLRNVRANHQGSIVAISNSSSVAVAMNSYDEWGVPATTNVGRFGYTGQVYIPELNLYYYKARIYAPRLGRFLQTDPVGYEDQVNLYAYVANDPSNKIDSTGTEGDDIVVTAGCRLFCNSIRGAALEEFLRSLVGFRAGPIAGAVVLAAYPTTLGSDDTCASGCILNDKIPDDAKDPNGAKAPGKPGEAEGFKDPKGGERWGKAPNGKSGWVDKKGNIWVPTGQGSAAHGRGGGLKGAHWDVQFPSGGYKNVYPGGKVR